MRGNITFVIVNFNTPKLLRFCVESLLDYYNDISILLVDNGSDDTTYLQSLSIKKNNIRCLFNPVNLTHGTAMHQAMHLCSTDYVFLLDSDCIVKKGGFIEEMMSYNGAYAVGDIQLVNRNGVNIPKSDEAIRYVHPSSMLVDRGQYFTLPPFIAHGAPCIDNMIQANRIGLQLVDFPIRDYIVHIGRGTREGINVTWDGKAHKPKGFWSRISGGNNDTKR